ncbi:MAG: FHA domain-containing protein [Candidatus Promineifilaceae bacterium]
MVEEKYQLVVIEGPEAGQSFQLGLDTVIMGRDRYADIVFDHPEVSRHHARLTRAEGGYTVQDRNSTNGTFVDGKRLGSDPVLLQTGMTIRLGRAVILTYEIVSTVDPKAKVVTSSLIDETTISEPGNLPSIQDTVTLIAVEALDNPYVGPRAFEPNERQFFYGRDEEIAILTGQVMSRRASVFFAQSGAGKSSLLRAGLIPELTRKVKVGRGPRARVVRKMRVLPILEVGYNPTDEQLAATDNVYVLGALLKLYPKRPVAELASLSLCQGLAPYFDGQAGENAAGGTEGSRAYEDDLATLLIFDQFEELFTYHPEQWLKREDFFRQVNQALEEYPELHVVFTMREDFIAELTPYANLLPDRLRVRFRLERLKRDAALQAIVAPAKRAGRTFAEGVAEELVDNLRRGQPKQDRAGRELDEEVSLGAYVEPVHLQIVCRQLWENLPTKRRVIEAADVQAFGDVDQALIDFYESTLAEVVARTEISQRQLRGWFDHEVITPARTRGLVYKGESETEGLPNAAAEILNDAYIIRADVRGGDVWYQLAHDRLVEPVLKANAIWRENYHNPLDKVTRDWVAAGRNRERLLQGSQLAIAQAYADENPNDVLPEEREFLRESYRQEQLAAEQAELRARRRRRTIIAAGVVGAFLLLATIFSITQMIVANNAREEADQNAQLAEEKAQEAQAARTEAESEAQRADEEAQRALQSAERARAAQDVAQKARDEAEEQRDLAEEQRNEADRQRKEAERQTRLSQAEGLAANALAEGSRDVFDPSLVLILARMAVNITYRADGTVQDNARRALIQAVAEAPPWQMNLPRYAHDGAIMRAVFSPDGQRIASASADGTAKVWDVTSKATVLTLVGHRGTVNSAVFSPDGTRLVTASDDETARIWDASSGEQLLVLQGHGDRVDYATFDAQGERVVTAGADGVAIVWDAESGEQLAVLAGHSDIVPAANFDPQGGRVVTASADGSARVWDAESGQELLVLEGQAEYIIWAVFDDAGERIATSSLDGRVQVWDANSGELLVSTESSGEAIASVNFSSDGQQLVIASWDWYVATLDASNADLIHAMVGHLDQVNFADFSPDDQQIVSASNDGTMRIWDATTGDQLDVLGGSGGPAMKVEFNNDGTQLAAGLIDGTVVLWDLESGEDVLRFRAHEHDLTGMDISPDGQLIATAGSDGPAKLWDAESGALVRTIEGHEGAATDVAFSPDSASVATVGTDGQLRITDVGSGDLRIYRTDVGEPGGLKFVVYSNDGSRIAAYDEVGKQIQIRGAATGQVYLSMRDKSGIESIQFSPDDRTILTSNTDGTITNWDVYSGADLGTLQVHGNYVRSAAFSPDGSLIVTASDDTTAKVWDAETGDDLYTLLGHGNWLTYATFSPDGRLIASTDLDGVTKVWNVAASSLIPQLEYDNVGLFPLAAYTPDGRRLVTRADDFVIKVWDVENGRRLWTIDGENLDQTPFDGATDLALLPVLNENGTVDLWDVNNDQLTLNVAGNNIWVNAADVSADGRIVVTLGCDGWDEVNGFCTEAMARIWDGTSGQEIQTFPYEGLGDKTFELSHDGTRLILGYCADYDEEGTTCLESQLTIWDTTTGAEIKSWSIGDGEVSWIDYSPDQKGIFTTNGSVTRFWDAESGELRQEVSGRYKTTDPLGQCIVTLTGNLSSAMIWDIRTGKLLGTLSGHRDLITSIEFSPDSERLITSSWDNTARVWDSRTGIEILNLDDHEGQVWKAHFSPDGTSIVTAGEDGTARIWPFAVDRLLELSGPAVQRYSPYLTPTELARFGLADN